MFRNFVCGSTRAFRGTVGERNGRFDFDLSESPRSVRESIRDQVKFAARFQPTTSDDEIYLSRTHPITEGLATYVMDSALDTASVADGLIPAARCGVIRTRQVQKRTTLLLLRLRYHIITTKGETVNPLLAEDTQIVGFRGAPSAAEWIPAEEAEDLLLAQPDDNVSDDVARGFIQKVVDPSEFDHLRAHLDAIAEAHGKELLDAHKRVRTASKRTASQIQHRATTSARCAWALHLFTRHVRSKLMTVEAACIDITGSSRSMDIAFIEDNVLRLRTASDLSAFLDWIDSKKPKLVAIDAPCKENTGQVPNYRNKYDIPEDKYENFRVSEVLLKLKGIGLYNTPQENPPGWMKRGWDLYALMVQLGYALLETPGETERDESLRMMEVHPHASFVVGLGWIPQTKKSLAGQLERAAYLRKECESLGIDASGTPLSDDQLQELAAVSSNWNAIAENGITLPEISHDELDAMVGLTTAVRAIRGEAYAVG